MTESFDHLDDFRLLHLSYVDCIVKEVEPVYDCPLLMQEEEDHVEWDAVSIVELEDTVYDDSPISSRTRAPSMLVFFLDDRVPGRIRTCNSLFRRECSIRWDGHEVLSARIELAL